MVRQQELTAFIKNIGPKGKTWLAKLSTEIANTSVIPKLWREVIAIAKPEKPTNDPPHCYRPISLLSMVYKVFETSAYKITTCNRENTANRTGWI